MACLGGARSSLEAQGALKLFCRTQGWRDPQFFWDPALERKVKTAVGRLDEGLAVSMGELGGADFILVAGADPVNEAPMLALALRQAWRQGARVAVLDPRPVFLPFEFEPLAVPPGQLDAALGALAKGALSPEAAAGLTDPARGFYDALPGRYPGDPAVAARLMVLAEALAKSKKPVVVCGTDIVRETTPALAADIALLLRAAGQEAGLFYLLPGANAFGAALISAPESADAGNPSGGQWPWGPAAVGEPTGPGEPALSAEAILEGIDQGRIKALVLVENDPFWSFSDEARLAGALDRLELLIVLDYVPSRGGQTGPRGAPHHPGVRGRGRVLRQPGGPGPSRLAGPSGGDAARPHQPRRPSAPDLARPRPRERPPAPGADFSRADPGPVRVPEPGPRGPVGLAGPAPSRLPARCRI